MMNPDARRSIGSAGGAGSRQGRRCVRWVRREERDQGRNNPAGCRRWAGWANSLDDGLPCGPRANPRCCRHAVLLATPCGAHDMLQVVNDDGNDVLKTQKYRWMCIYVNTSPDDLHNLLASPLPQQQATQSDGGGCTDAPIHPSLALVLRRTQAATCG